MHFTSGNWPNRVSRHNLVYLTPAQDPMQGWALGNGEMGVLFWTEPNRLVAVVNRCDLIDAAKTPGPIRNWSKAEEETCAILRGGGRVVWEFPEPVFELAFLKEFRAELDIAHGELRLRCHSVFGMVSLAAFVTEGGKAVRARLSRRLAAEEPIVLRAEHYGSRVFGHWYMQFSNDAECGFAGTETQVSQDGMVITHPVSSGREGERSLGRFALAVCDTTQQNLRCISGNAVMAELPSRSGRDEEVVSETIALLTEPVASEASAAAAYGLTELSRELRHSREARARKIHSAWKAFWDASWLDCGDEYLNQLWHLQNYYAFAAQRGSYPGRFIGGLWFWMRDFGAWNHVFHWNQQMIYWPMLAAGHPETVRPYLEWRWKALDKARKAAREFFGAEGGWVSDVTSWEGEPSVGESHNHTPMGQIALEFYHYWQYAGDGEFLRERAIPYMVEAARFLLSRFEKQADGKCHGLPGTSYEGWNELTDLTTELATAKALFAALWELSKHFRVAEKSFLEQLKDVAGHLADFTSVEDLELFSDAQGRRACGAFRGCRWLGGKRLGVGRLAEDGKVTAGVLARRKSGEEKAASDEEQAVLDTLCAQADLPRKNFAGESDAVGVGGIFPYSELSVIYPSGLVGLARRRSELFKMAYNSLMVWTGKGDDVAWNPTPVMLARMGEGDRLYDFLKSFTMVWQNHENGWFADSTFTRETLLPKFRNRVVEVENCDGENAWQAKDSQRRALSAWPFRHMGLEGLGVTATAISESLLQSYDGILRIAPAFPRNRSGAFTLKAVGGHTVSARISNGKVLWVVLTLGYAGRTVLENPWGNALLDSKARLPERKLRFQGTAGTVFVLTDADAPKHPDAKLEEVPAVPKEHEARLCHLGLERLW